ncbi:unnamed protein product, partial [Didymodactylos carnosus]
SSTTMSSSSPLSIMSGTTSITTTDTITTSLQLTTTSVSTTALTTTITTSLQLTTTSVSTTALTTTILASSPAATGAFGTNIVVNGDGETGVCETSSGSISPLGWTTNGPITQVSYFNSVYGDLSFSDPGPSDRGCCYFFGQISANTSMSQTINLTAYSTAIDAHNVSYNLSAWLGGYMTDDDSASVIVRFFSQSMLLLGSSAMIGPVLAAARASLSKLLYRSTTGMVMVNVRYLQIQVVITRFVPNSNDGDVDDISVVLSQ